MLKCPLQPRKGAPGCAPWSPHLDESAALAMPSCWPLQHRSRSNWAIEIDPNGECWIAPGAVLSGNIRLLEATTVCDCRGAGGASRAGRTVLHTMFTVLSQSNRLRDAQCTWPMSAIGSTIPTQGERWLGSRRTGDGRGPQEHEPGAAAGRGAPSKGWHSRAPGLDWS
jgi:hypothetical protein